MKIMKLAAVLAAFPLLTAAATPFAPVRLTLQKGWVADYGADSCRMIGEFGQGPQSATLMFEQVAPNDGLTMLVMSKLFNKSLYGTRSFSAYFMPQAKAGSRHGQSVSGNDPSKTPGALWQHVSFEDMPTVDEELALQKDASRMMRAAMRGSSKSPPTPPPPPTPEKVAEIKAQSEANAKATAVQIMEPGHGSILLETGPMSVVVAAMKSCATTQLERWGIDPKVEEKIAKRAELRDWWKLLGPNDYPTDSLRKGEESQLAVRVLVDAQGRPTGCTPITPVDPPTFGKVVCSRLMKAHVQPATLEDGSPVASYVITHIKFMMP